MSCQYCFTRKRYCRMREVVKKITKDRGYKCTGFGCEGLMIRRHVTDKQELTPGNFLRYRMSGWYCDRRGCGSSLHTQVDMAAAGVCNARNLCWIEGKGKT
jgi:hypothetical protein